jgi:GMP synthase-like glutamine amidotransferase
MSRIHFLQHVAFEGPGSIAHWAKTRGHFLSVTHLYREAALPPQDAFDCLVVMGGPMNIYEYDAHPWLTGEKRFIAHALKNRKTILGICLGAQLLADVLGQKVYAGRHREIGWFPVTKTKAACQARTADFMPDTAEVFHWHGDTFDIPAGALHLAESEACPSQGFIYDQQVIGLQFHLETTRTSARQLIENCGEELAPDTFIQSPAEMLADERRFNTINGLMASLLESLPLFGKDTQP